MANRIYMSPYQVGQVRGLDEVMSHLSEMFLGHPSGAETTFYASVFQAGVDQLMVPAPLVKELPDNAFVKDRAQTVRREAADTDYKVIHEMFARYLPEDYQRDEKFKDVWTLESLLIDLCVCLRLKVNLLFPGILSEPESLRGILPPELLLPATSLLSAIGTLPAAGHLPRYRIQKTDVGNYNEIVRSGLFHELSEAHIPLSDQEAAVETAFRQVRQAAARLQGKYVTELRLVRLGVSLLPLVPKLVDETMGSFPGKVAEHLAKLAQASLENRRRLVIYDSSEIQNEIMLNTILYIAKNKDDDAIVKSRIDRHKKENPELSSKEEVDHKDTDVDF